MPKGFGYSKKVQIIKPSRNTLCFISESLLLICETESNSVKLNLHFKKNLKQLNESLLSTLPCVFRKYIREADPSEAAMLFGSFGNLIGQFPLGKIWLNQELSLLSLQLALEVYSREDFPEKWAMVQNDLAAAYIRRIRKDRSNNIEDAISAYHLALEIFTYAEYQDWWAMIQENLAITYIYRIKGERSDNLKQAINAAKKALQVFTCEAFPYNWGMAQNNLATAYRDYLVGDRSANIEQSIKAYKLALKTLTTKEFPEKWAAIQNNLATVYRVRIEGDRTDNIERAMDCCQLALQVRSRNALPEEWAATQNNLANIYGDRIAGDRSENSEKAITAAKSALEVYTFDEFPERWAGAQNNLASAYMGYIEAGNNEYLDQAVMAYELALQVYTSEAFPKDCRDTAQNLGKLHFQKKNWASVDQAYSLALVAAEILYQSSISLNGKDDELKATGTMPHRLAYAQSQLGNPQQALLTLERSRARGLSETLNRDRANLTELQQTHAGLCSQYQDITQQFRNLESQQRSNILTPEVLRTTAAKLRSDLETTIAKIRQVPGYEDFLTPITWEDIQNAVTIDRPLVCLVITSNGGMALIVTVESIEVLWLNDLKEETLQEILYGPAEENQSSGYLSAYQDFRNDSKTNYPAWCKEIDTTTRQLWDLLIDPVVQHLKSLGIDRATLIPTGYLSLFPLHAAWTEDATRPTGRRYALDDIHFTYTPNARSLTAARTIAEHTKSDTILAIDNPDQSLPNSHREINSAINSFTNRTVLRHGVATIAAVQAELATASVAHFSCHGTANFNEPLNSGLLMSDGLLTLRQLFDLKLTDNTGIRLAILSACETGLPGLENIDEIVSLPVGLLQTGVAAVISSHWSVSDLSTMILLSRFYDLWRKDRLEPAIALHQAQQWMAHTTDGEKAKYCGLGTLTPDEYTYAHPFHWAAFSYLGA